MPGLSDVPPGVGAKPGQPAGVRTGRGPAARPRLWPLYAGGFLGPFGGAMVAAMLPELAEGFDTTVGVAAWSLTAYLLPFAGLMVVSGTLGERWGRRRTLLGAYLTYVVASLVCAVAPDIPLFLSGRVLQGAANAFTTPILIAAISDLVEPDRLGGAMGKYGSLQAAGQSFAPLIGGLAATVQWRAAFVGSVVAALALVTVLPSDPAADGVAAARPREGRVRSLFNRKLALASGVAFLSHATATGITVLVALLASDRFGLGPGPRGLVVATFGAAGLLAGGPLGRAVDRLGPSRFGSFAALALALAAVAAGTAPVVAGVVLAVMLAGGAATATRIAVTTLAVTSTPGNRGGATSIALAFLFFGGALAPVLWLPVYDADRTAGLVAAGSGALAAAAVLATVSARGRADQNGRTSAEASAPERPGRRSAGRLGQDGAGGASSGGPPGGGPEGGGPDDGR